MKATLPSVVGLRNSHRRSCLATIAAACWASLAASSVVAQSTSRAARVGTLTSAYGPGSPPFEAFIRRLAELGYVRGKNVVIESRHAGGQNDKLSELAAELAALKVDVILTDVTFATRAAIAAAPLTPVVMALAADPVRDGLVASLGRPGGRVTGVAMMLTETTTKRLQLIKEVLPAATRVAVVWNPATPWHRSMLPLASSAAAQLGFDLRTVPIERAEDLETAFASMAKSGTHAVLFGDTPLFESHRAPIAALELRHRLPAIHSHREWAAAGALMSYGTSNVDTFARAAEMTAKIVQGAKPSEMPVEQPTTFEFVVNARTAKRFGLSIPSSVLVRASEVLE